jgi:hypothetical protein
MARTGRRSTVTHQWQQVRVSIQCARGHQVDRGEWVRFSQAGYQRLATCEGCLLKHYGIKRPNTSFGFNDDPGVDVRARQVGDE